MNLQLAGNVLPMGDYRVDGDEKMLGYLFVRHALYNACYDFLFTLAQFGSPFFFIGIGHIQCNFRLLFCLYQLLLLYIILQTKYGRYKQILFDLGMRSQILFAQEDIDGGLIGGASLKAVDFSKIVAAASK